MLLGADALGRLALGQIPRTPRRVIEVTVSLSVVGVASATAGADQSTRVAGVGPGFRRVKVVNAFAFGGTVIVHTELEPGVATGVIVEPPVIEPAPVAEFVPEPLIIPVDGRAQGSRFELQSELAAGQATGGAVATGAVIVQKIWTRYDNDLVLLMAA